VPQTNTHPSLVQIGFFKMSRLNYGANEPIVIDFFGSKEPIIN